MPSRPCGRRRPKISSSFALQYVRVAHVNEELFGREKAQKAQKSKRGFYPVNLLRSLRLFAAISSCLDLVAASPRCETVLAEVVPILPSDEVPQFLSDWKLTFVPSSQASALLAGEMFRAYLQRGGKRGRVVPDFLIAAHAQTHAQRLLARDRGFYRDYFKQLNLWDPTTAPSAPA